MARITEEQRKRITCEEARELFAYCPETGILSWRRHMSPRARAGSHAGCVGIQGYRRVLYRRINYLSHRVIWLIVTGEWPTSEIDHANGVRDDNRWENLRLATTQQNRWNTPHKNRSGLIGASYIGATGKYRSIITRPDGKKVFLGKFETAEEASSAYLKASHEFHGEFSVGVRDGKNN